MKKLNIILVNALIITLMSCSGGEANQEETSAAAEATEVAEEKKDNANSRESKNVVMHHLSAFQSNDIGAIMEDYADNAVLMTPEQSFVGKDQIHDFFVELFKTFPSEGTKIEMDRFDVDNDLVYILWNGSTPFVNVRMGSDTFIIKDKLIQKQTFAGWIEPIKQKKKAS